MPLKTRLIALSIWSAAMLVCAWLALTHAPLTTDLDAFLPAGGGAARLLSELRAGPVQRLILMGITGGTEEARAAVSVALAARLHRTNFFLRVANGENLMNASERRLLFSHRYLLSPNISASTFSAASLGKALRARLTELRSAAPVTDTRAIAADPTREFYELLNAWAGGNHPASRLGVWFSSDGRQALLLAETKASGFDLDAQTKVVAAIKAAFNKASAAHPKIRLLLSGPPVFATAAQSSIRGTVASLSTAASIATALILIFAYRSWLPLLLATLPLASAILVAVAAAGLLFGKIYGITLAFGMTLLGVAMDYPVHLFSHRSRAEKLAVTLRHVWPILRLGAAATALGYTAMLTADLPGLKQLGVFAVAGLMTAAAVTRWALPALLPADWTPAHAGGGAWMDPLLEPKSWVAVLLLTVCAAALVATLIAAPRVWEDDLASLSPVPARQLAVDKKLRAALGAPEAGHLAIIKAPDAQTALARSEALARRLQQATAKHLIGGFDMAARYLPSIHAQRARQLRLPPRKQLQANLKKALAGLPFRPGAFEPFAEDVQAARADAPLRLADLRGSAVGARVNSLLFNQGDGWLALVTLSGVSNSQALSAWFTKNAPEASYVDIDVATRDLMTHFREAGMQRAAIGALLIVALLIVSLRDIKMVLASVAPVALAVCVTVCALLALEPGGLTLFHIVSLLLVVGICIDYSLFFSHHEQDMALLRQTLHAVLVCTGSTVLVFAMLALSSVPVLRAIGLTVAIGVSASFVLALGLAPLLSGREPEARERNTIKK